MNLKTSLLCILSFVLLLHSCNSKTKQKETNDELRAILKYYPDSNFHYSQKKHIQYPQDSQNLDTDEKFAYHIANTRFDASQLASHKLEELQKIYFQDDFQMQNNINRFYTILYISQLFSEQSNLSKAFDYAILAQDLIMDYPDELMLEKPLQKEEIRNIASALHQMYPEIYVDFYDNVHNSSKKDILKNKEQFFVSLGHYYNQEKDFAKSLKYLNKAKETLDVPLDNTLQSMVSGVYYSNFLNLDKKDSADKIQKKMSQQLKKGLINQYDYDIFSLYVLDGQIGLVPDKELIANLQQIEKSYTSDCSNKYILADLYKVKSKVYQHSQQAEAEKQALLSEEGFYNLCDNFNRPTNKEITRVYKRLIHLDVQMENYNEARMWQNNLDYLKTHKIKEKNLFLKILTHMMDRDLEYTQLNLDRQKEVAHTSIVIKTMYILFIIFLIIMIFYVSYSLKLGKKLNQELHHKQQTLKTQNERIQLQYDRMKDIVQSLKESNESLKNFASIVAHDVKSPISTIYQAVDYLSTKYHQIIIPVDNEVIQNLKTSTDNLQLLINNMLDFSSVKKQIITKPVITQIVLQNVLSDLETYIQEVNAHIQYPDNLPVVRANEPLLQKVFNFLISSALKNRSKNILPIVIIEYTITDENKAKFSLENNDIGMSKTKLESMFNFFGDDKKKNDLNDDINLALCRKIIEELGGEIWVDSEINIGTTFYFTIPLSQNQTIKESI